MNQPKDLLTEISRTKHALNFVMGQLKDPGLGDRSIFTMISILSQELMLFLVNGVNGHSFLFRKVMHILEKEAKSIEDLNTLVSSLLVNLSIELLRYSTTFRDSFVEVKRFNPF